MHKSDVKTGSLQRTDFTVNLNTSVYSLNLEREKWDFIFLMKGMEQCFFKDLDAAIISRLNYANSLKYQEVYGCQAVFK